MKNIAFISLGCDKNLVDSEVALGKLVAAGYNSFSSPKEAQLLVLNTCAFIDEACQETEEWIAHCISLKKEDPQKILVVMGCYVERFKERLPSLYPEVDYWVGVNDFPYIVEILQNQGKETLSRVFVNSPPFLYNEKTERILSTPAHYAYLKIAEGCNHRCSFCIIPSIRGTLRSRPWESILKEALNLASMGVQEIILVAQDLSSYGVDIYQKRSLPLLLRKLGEHLPPSLWIRLLYLAPHGINNELLEVIASTKQILKYLDIPLQHVNTNILKNMNRPFNTAEIEKMLSTIRQYIPDITLRTTFMVGFPGEDEEIFKELLDFARYFRFERMGAFLYSEQKGTPASFLQPKVDEKTKKERYQKLMKLQKEIMREYHYRLQKQELEVILDEGPQQEKGKSYFWGRTTKDAPQIDAQVKAWMIGKKAITPGKIVRARVNQSSAYQLEGEIV
ncbi:MAG: 30S ribosomal protein S12 methylthiotransferase RimO [Candidatus Caldatribacteriaceae bacterium]